MGKLILTAQAKIILGPVILNGHHKILAPPVFMVSCNKGHAVIDGQKVFIVDDINSFKINVTYITLKGHVIPGQGILQIDSSKAIKAKWCLSTKTVILHDNKLPLKFKVNMPAKMPMPSGPPQDDPLKNSMGVAAIIPHNRHVFAAQ
ncbi:TPA: hypothetical protein QH957_002282 [Enterobacter bugandensis]|nr:hypothetical protein [Enterobacter bugandensis]